MPSLLIMTTYFSFSFVTSKHQTQVKDEHAEPSNSLFTIPFASLYCHPTRYAKDKAMLKTN
jgi:hypothetical protein